MLYSISLESHLHVPQWGFNSYPGDHSIGVTNVHKVPLSVCPSPIPAFDPLNTPNSFPLCCMQPADVALLKKATLHRYPFVNPCNQMSAHERGQRVRHFHKTLKKKILWSSSSPPSRQISCACSSIMTDSLLKLPSSLPFGRVLLPILVQIRIRRPTI